MIYVRAQHHVVKLLDLGSRMCPTCERNRPFSLYLIYDHSDLYLLFGKVDKKQYFELCEICSRGPEIPATNAEQRIGRVPIPFMQRFGCLAVLLAFHLLLAVTFIMAAVNSKRMAEDERLRQEIKRVRIQQSAAQQLHDPQTEHSE
jgi:hypothetical protein